MVEGREIKKGDYVLCIKTVIMDTGNEAFTEGKIYKSEYDGYLTNNQGNTEHGVYSWEGDTDEDKYFFQNHFKLISDTQAMSLKLINGKPNTTGIKETEAKSDYSEINLDILDLMSERMMANKHKYPKGNSKRPIPEGTLEWAMFRHIKKILKPIPNDPETKRDHLAAIACNVSMILDQMELVPSQEVPKYQKSTDEDFWKAQAEHWNKQLFGETEAKIYKN